MDFHVRPRLIRHLAYAAKRCLVGLEAAVSPLTDEAVKELDNADRAGRAARRAQGRAAHWAERPPQLVPGARLRPDDAASQP